MARSSEPLILLINGNEDFTDALGVLLEQEGFRWRAVRQPDIHRGRVDVAALLREDPPGVIVYDVALPYELAAALLRRLQALPETRGVPFVLTTPHKPAAEPLVGPDIIEMLLKPFDVEQFLRAVKTAASWRDEAVGPR